MVFGDFDGDGFPDALYFSAGASGSWYVGLYNNKRIKAQGRIQESDNSWGGRTELTWDFTANGVDADLDNASMPMNIEVLKRVDGAEGAAAFNTWPHTQGAEAVISVHDGSQAPTPTPHAGNARNPLSVSQLCAKKTPRAAGVTPVSLPPRNPDLTAYAERFVRSIKSQGLDRLIIIGERHLRTAISEHAERTH